MKNKQKNKFIVSSIALLLLVLMSAFTLTGCVKTTPSVVIGFKTNGQQSGEYSEAIEEFVIGERFYCAVAVKLVTNKKKPRDYTVEIEIPKTTEVQMTERGGLEPFSKYEDQVSHTTTLKYNVQGSKEAVQQKMMFSGVPFEEGSVRISVKIYDEDNELVGNGYFMVIYFVYE